MRRNHNVSPRLGGHAHAGPAIRADGFLACLLRSRTQDLARRLLGPDAKRPEPQIPGKETISQRIRACHHQPRPRSGIRAHRLPRMTIPGPPGGLRNQPLPYVHRHSRRIPIGPQTNHAPGHDLGHIIGRRIRIDAAQQRPPHMGRPMRQRHIARPALACAIATMHTGSADCHIGPGTDSLQRMHIGPENIGLHHVAGLHVAAFLQRADDRHNRVTINRRRPAIDHIARAHAASPISTRVHTLRGLERIRLRPLQ